MMLTYDARTQPIRGSGLGQYFYAPQKWSASVGPLAPNYAHIARATEPNAQRSYLCARRSAHIAQRPRTDGGGRVAAAVAAYVQAIAASCCQRARNVCTLARTQCSENLGNLTMCQFFLRGVGVRTVGHGVSSFLARLITGKFRKIVKGTALFALSNTHNPKSHTGSNRALPERRTASAPTSTSLMPTSSLTGSLSQFSMCTSLNTH
jgi:hypothetical protein